MRIHRFFSSSAFLVLVLITPALLRAQFHEPTPEELKMTDDPKAPGAAAVYLDFQEIANDPLHYQSYYARIKVLQEKAKEAATVELPYFRGNRQITNIKGRTIHSDGTIIPLDVKPEDLLIAKSGDTEFARKVFTLPSVEVGSILEYSYDLRYDDNHYSSPFWELQKQYFVHKAHYAFTPFESFQKGEVSKTTMRMADAHGNMINSMQWWSILPPGVQLKNDASGHISLDVTDMPPVPHEQWMPPIDSFLYKVNFYYISAFSGADYWESEAKNWSKDVDHFAEPTRPIQQAVAGIVAPGDTDIVKAKKLYKAVQALDNTDFSRKKGEAELKQLGLHLAKRAEDTWSQKSGSRQDIALLYLSMLRTAGLTAYDMKVVSRDRGVFATGYFNIDQLDDDIVILSLAGKEIYLDPGEKMCPFQIVSWKHSGAGGIRQTAAGRSLAVSPMLPYTANTISRSGDINFDEHGAATGYFRFLMSGERAMHWRQVVMEVGLEDAKKRFDESLVPIVPAGTEAHIDHFLSLDDIDADLMAVVKTKGTLGSATGKRLILPGAFFETRAPHPFVDQEKRLEPVDMHYAERVDDDITYHLPPGMAVEGAPQETKIPWEGHAVLSMKTETDAGDITITRQLARGITFAKPEDYQELRAFYQKVAAADQQQLVLTTSSAPKGN
jgi:hypothetical protein